jgi:hypothetical protein
MARFIVVPMNGQFTRNIFMTSSQDDCERIAVERGQASSSISALSVVFRDLYGFALYFCELLPPPGAGVGWLRRKAGMPGDFHRMAAEMHELAAHAHQVAAEHHGKQDHLTAHEYSRQALDHARRAFEHAQEAHRKSAKAAGKSE